MAAISLLKVKRNEKEKTSLLLETLARIVKSTAAKVGVAIFLVIIIACAGAALFAPYDYNDMDLDNMFANPSAAHIFGADGLGRDLFSRILYGGRYSLCLGLFASLLGGAVGTVIGAVAGYFGKKPEMIIMRIMDLWASIPGMLLCIMISATLGTGFLNTALALAIGNVPASVRLIRGQVLSERTKEYLEAAESINCSKLSIIFWHLLPNVISPMIVHLTMNIGGTIIMASALSYIGLGVQPPTPEWGALLSDARIHILNHPNLIMFPGLVIALTVFAINLIGDGLRDALDPKLRS